MEHKSKTHFFEPLFCLSYNLTEESTNKIFYMKDANDLISNSNQKIPIIYSHRLLQNNEACVNSQEIKSTDIKEKRIYNENDYFVNELNNQLLHKKTKRPKNKVRSPERDRDIIPSNSLDLPEQNTYNIDNDNSNDSDLHINCPRTNQAAVESHIREGEVDRSITGFNEFLEKKAKDKMIKKFVSHYKKISSDNGKVNEFISKLALQVNESPQDIQEWLKTELLLNRIETYPGAICKEVKLYIQMINSHHIDLTNGEQGDQETLIQKKQIAKKIQEYFNHLSQFEKSINQFPVIGQLMGKYSSIKSKKKQLNQSTRDKMTKKIKECFEKSSIKLTDEKIKEMFFPLNTPNIHTETNIIKIFNEKAPMAIIHDPIDKGQDTSINTLSNNRIQLVVSNSNNTNNHNGNKVFNIDNPNIQPYNNKNDLAINILKEDMKQSRKTIDNNNHNNAPKPITMTTAMSNSQPKKISQPNKMGIPAQNTKYIIKQYDYDDFPSETQENNMGSGKPITYI